MARLQLTLLAVCVVALLSSPGVLAQPGQGRGYGGRIYNPATETTLTGTVESVENIAPGEGRRGMGGLHLTLKTATESIEVHVGPLMFLHEKGVRIEKGDTLKILGSRVTIDGKPVLIAREITKGDQTVTLRDEAGRPHWSGGWK